MITPRHREDHGRRAIIDIGSNSVRLVIYAGRDRPDEKLVSDKVTAGLGKLDRKGRLPAAGLKIAKDGLKRFRAIADDYKIKVVHAFATAAVRDAAGAGSATGGA